MKQIKGNEIINYLVNYFKNNVKFSFSDFKNHFKLTDEEHRKYIDELLNKNYLLRNVSQYKPGKKLLAYLKPKLEETVIKEKFNIFQVLKSITLINSFRFTAFIVGCMLVFLSGVFSYMWFIKVLHPVLAIVISIAWVASSIILFESIIYIIRNKKKLIYTENKYKNIIIKITYLLAKYSSVTGLFLVWIIVVSFSIGSTIAGQYDNFKSKIESSKISGAEINTIDNKLIFESYDKQLNLLYSELESYDIERSVLIKQINKLEEMNRAYYDINWRIGVKNKAMNKIKEQITEIENNKNKLLSEKKLTFKENFNFFEWLSKILNISSDKIQLIWNFFPALMIDIVAPLCFAITIFLKDVKEEVK